MTKEERTIQEQIRENERMQKRLSDLSFKQTARFKALEVAQNLDPSSRYVAPRGEGAGKPPIYDVVKKAEEIYQWLIKVLK